MKEKNWYEKRFGIIDAKVEIRPGIIIMIVDSSDGEEYTQTKYIFSDLSIEEIFVDKSKLWNSTNHLIQEVAMRLNLKRKTIIKPSNYIGEIFPEYKEIIKISKDFSDDLERERKKTIINKILEAKDNAGYIDSMIEAMEAEKDSLLTLKGSPKPFEVFANGHICEALRRINPFCYLYCPYKVVWGNFCDKRHYRHDNSDLEIPIRMLRTYPEKYPYEALRHAEEIDEFIAYYKEARDLIAKTKDESY